MKPKHAAGHDKNHFIVRDYLAYVCGGMVSEKRAVDVVYLASRRGIPVGAIDTSRLGGFWLDWLIFAGHYCALVEVKTPEAYRKPNNDLRPSEAWAIANLPLRAFVVCDDDGVSAAFEVLLAEYAQNYA